VVANLADLTSLPYFTTITVEGLMKSAGGAPVWVKTGVGGVRQATKSDLIRLEADSIGMPNMAGIPKGFSAAYPLPDEDVLDEKETMQALAITKEYNQIIKALAEKKKLALMDANALLKKISAGLVEDGVPVNSSYITGNVFSLDGVHLTPKGNAITANEFIKVINQYYKTSIPKLNTAQYPGLL
jgi:lysophospholipase L1-like esterase